MLETECHSEIDDNEIVIHTNNTKFVYLYKNQNILSFLNPEYLNA